MSIEKLILFTISLIYFSCATKLPLAKHEVGRNVASGGGEVDSSGDLKGMKYLYWVPFQGQGALAIASQASPQDPCDGKIYLVKSKNSEILAAASGTSFTTTPIGQALCGDNNFIDQHISFQTYDISNNKLPLGETGASRLLVVLINENSNYHSGNVTLGDIFLVEYRDSSSPEIVAKCTNCSNQLNSELRRLLPKSQFDFYKEFHPDQRFSKKLNSLNYKKDGSSFVASLNADLGGTGCWWNPGDIKIRTQLQIKQEGDQLSLKIEKANLTGSKKSCLGPR